jgi:SPP1 family predicted phage head-tail adaptor
MPRMPKNAYQPYMRPADLRFPMALQKSAQVRTPSGNYTTTWTNVDDEVWVELIPLQGAQLYYAQSFAPRSNAMIRIRYRDDVKAGMRLYDPPDAYTIISPPIDIEGAGTVLLLYCQQLRTSDTPG